MNDETRPSEEGTPPAPPEWSPPAPAAPTPPAASTSGMPPAPPAAMPPSTPSGRPKIDVGMFLLGLITPVALAFLAGAMVAGLSALIYNDVPMSGPTPLQSMLGPVIGLISPVLIFGTFAACLVALLVGRSKGNNRLRSFGLGGIWAFGGMLLLGLLAFGACFIALSGFGQ